MIVYRRLGDLEYLEILLFSEECTYVETFNICLQEYGSVIATYIANS